MNTHDTSKFASESSFQLSDKLLNPKRIDFKYIDVLTRLATDDVHLLQPTVDATGFSDKANNERYIGYKSPVIHYISDNAGNTTDTAPLEIDTRLEDINAFFETVTGLRGPRTKYHDIPSQDTFAAAFDLAQGSRGAIRGFGNIFFVNCAPRKKQAGVKKKNGGEKIYVGVLPNGAIVAGTGEDAFTHFKDLVRDRQMNIYEANVQTNGSQFRSRDIFPHFAQILGWHIAQPTINRSWRSGLSVEDRDGIILSLNSINIGKKLELEAIPDLLQNGAIVQRRDIHLNAKTGLRHEDIRQAFKGYQEVVVYARVGKAVRAHIATASFEKEPGMTVVSAGSSGVWTDANGIKTSPFAEIFTVAGKAIEKLGLTDDAIKAGAEIHIVPAILLDKAKRELFGDTVISDELAISNLIERKLIDGINFEPLRTALKAPARYHRQLLTKVA